MFCIMFNVFIRPFVSHLINNMLGLANWPPVISGGNYIPTIYVGVLFLFPLTNLISFTWKASAEVFRLRAVLCRSIFIWKTFGVNWICLTSLYLCRKEWCMLPSFNINIDNIKPVYFTVSVLPSSPHSSHVHVIICYLYCILYLFIP